ncbi:MAG TPA: hypothetical protein VIK55_19325 [Paludibacter sp.]
MKTRKRTFIKTVFLMLVRNERWYADPRNIEKIILMEQMTHKIGWV